MPKKPRRGRHALPEAERKDRLIQTRVAEDLDETLRDEARKKRVTVSQLIRNVLEDTFHLVDDLVADTAALTAKVSRDAQRLAASAKGQPAERAAPPAALDQVDAWQEVVLGRDAACARCQTPLRKGAKGLLGLQQDPAAPRLWLCLDCGARL